MHVQDSQCTPRGLQPSKQAILTLGQASPTPTQQNTAPFSVDTLKGHMTQTRQGTRSTKPKPATDDALPNTNNQLPPEKFKELYVYTDPISKLYTDDMV